MIFVFTSLSFFLLLTFSRSTRVCVEVCDLCFYLSFFLSSFFYLPFPGLFGFAWKCVIFVFTSLSFFLLLTFSRSTRVCVEVCDLCFYLSFFLSSFFYLPFPGLFGFAWKCVIFVFTSLSFFLLLTFSRSTRVCVEVCDLCFYLSFFLSSTYLFQVYSGLRGSV